jgi:hypothetical protein
MDDDIRYQIARAILSHKFTKLACERAEIVSELQRVESELKSINQQRLNLNGDSARKILEEYGNEG